jgi:hypothetical protein
LKIYKIFLYDEPAVQEIQISNLKNFLLETFHIDVEIKKCIFNNLDGKTIERISGCRILNLKWRSKNTFQANKKLILRKMFVEIPN